MRFMLVLAALLASAAAFAQEAPPPDLRLVGPTIGALQSLLTLREAQLKVLVEDAEKLAEKCGEPCKPKVEAPK